MKQTLLSLFLLVLISSCSSVKRNQRALNEGNFNEAIAIAVEKLQKGKTKRSNEEHILLLETAFRKISQAHGKRIAFLQKEGLVSNTQEIYHLYKNLVQIQKQIYPLLPLYIESADREAKFKFVDYSDALIHSKDAYVDYLYGQAVALMENNDKLSFRNAHATLTELSLLSPNYKNTNELLREAHFAGTDFVLVELVNRTEHVFPRKVEQDLLNFSTQGLDDFWTEYHGSMNKNYTYDYAVKLEFREIQISPERILEKEVPLEGEVLDSYHYKKDRSGNYVRDSLGNKIKIENYRTVKGTFYKTVQSKALSVQAKVDYFDLHNKQLLGSYPLQTEFIFENIFGSFQGDERLLSKEDKQIVKNAFLPFPSNEQMLVDASGDIKNRLVPILKQNAGTFRSY